MIKIALRRNLIYPIYLIFWAFLRKIVSILISKLFNFSGSVIYTFLMFLGELIGGFVTFMYQYNFIKQKDIPKEMLKKFRFSLIQGQEIELKKLDGKIKIFFLVFMTAFFDFFEFILSTYYIDKIHRISGSLQVRLGGVLILSSSLLYRFLLNIPMFKHQKFAFTLLVLCLLILIISEYFFQEFDGIITTKDLSLAIIFSVISYISLTFDDIIEKYLIEFDFLNPFIILFRQGIIGIIFTIICALIENPFKGLKDVYDNNSGAMFILFLFLLLLYSIFGALKNIYRMPTIMLFTPMNKNLADIIINPIYIVYYFIEGKDFSKNGQRNYLYFFTNLIILIIFDICGLIFNEFLILFCCRLDHDTYKSITERAISLEEMNILNEDDEEIEIEDTN
jgi:hypothetical protein